MSKSFARAVGVASVFLVAVACGGTNSPSVAIPSVAVPSVPPIVIPSGLPSFALPSFAIPSFNTNVDPELASRFPQQIDGQPVAGLQTVRFVDFLGFGGSLEDQQAFVATLAAAGIDANALVFGSGTATVDDRQVTLSAFRVAGLPAAQLLAVFPQVAVAVDPDQGMPTVGQTTIAGKTITTLTDSDGDADYFYPSGDIVWQVNSDDQAVLATVFGALP